MVLTFVHTLGEFGVVLMMGGSIPGETKTIAIAIYDRNQAFDLTSANRIAGSSWTRPGDGATIRRPRAQGWRRPHVQILRLSMTHVTHSVGCPKTGVFHSRRGANSTSCPLRIRLHSDVSVVQSI